MTEPEIFCNICLICNICNIICKLILKLLHLLIRPQWSLHTLINNLLDRNRRVGVAEVFVKVTSVKSLENFLLLQGPVSLQTEHWDGLAILNSWTAEGDEKGEEPCGKPVVGILVYWCILVLMYWCIDVASSKVVKQKTAEMHRKYHFHWFYPLSPTFIHFHSLSSAFIHFIHFDSTFIYLHPFHLLSYTFIHFHPLSVISLKSTDNKNVKFAKKK